ncbi:MAG: hypothetical protein JNJ50_15655 [Acidobacteria bacterium]|nr:hypothetical protein [Acidobacteriota bacterium]
MNMLRSKLTTLSQTFFFALAMLALTGAAFAQDNTKIWTAAASTGTPDEASQNLVMFSDSNATIAGSGQTTVVLRYNVTAVDGLFSGPLTPTNWPTMIVRYRDAHANAMQVIVELKEHIIAGPDAGQTNTLITFNSEEFPQLPGYQTQSLGNCGNFAGFQFLRPNAARVYYVEARLIRNASSNFGSPGLAGIAITRDGVCQGFSLTQ